MSATAKMLQTHPAPMQVNRDRLTSFIEETFQCAQACTACADACLSESQVQDLRYCIRANSDCADVCAATARMLSRQTAPDFATMTAQIRACEAACASCGTECRRHSEHHEHCRVCADQCQRCEEACRSMLAAIDERG